MSEKLKPSTEYSHEREFLLNLKKIGNTAEGRDVLWKLMAHCRVFHSIFTGNSVTFYNAGQRDVGLFIYTAILDADPQIYFNMIKERKKKEKENV